MGLFSWTVLKLIRKINDSQLIYYHFCSLGKKLYRCSNHMFVKFDRKTTFLQCHNLNILESSKYRNHYYKDANISEFADSQSTYVFASYKFLRRKKSLIGSCISTSQWMIFLLWFAVFVWCFCDAYQGCLKYLGADGNIQQMRLSRQNKWHIGMIGII